MRSRVSFAFRDEIQLAASIGNAGDIHPIVDGNRWQGVSIDIDHAEDATSPEILEQARASLRAFIALVEVGRGHEVQLTSATVESLEFPATGAVGLLSVGGGTLVVRDVIAAPSAALVQRVEADHRLLRQCEALVLARSSSNVVDRIKWSYMVLELETLRGGYTPTPSFRFVRNGVSHPELTRAQDTAYFRGILGVDFPDLRNPTHIRFLRGEADQMLPEAERVVANHLADLKFW